MNLMALLQQPLMTALGWALAAISVHLLGSLLMTAAGLMLTRALLLR